MAINFNTLHTRNEPPSRRHRVIEGERKTLFDSNDSRNYCLYFKDLLPSQKQQTPAILGKGAICNRLSELFMSRLNELGIETHFVKRLNMSEQLVKASAPFPFRLMIHNVAVDHLAQRLGIQEQTVFSRPIIEFSSRCKELNYPVISGLHIEALEWAHADELDDIISIAHRVNDFLRGQFCALDLRLLNFTLEFGRLYSEDPFEGSRLVLIDEISPDTCGILDLKSGDRLDGSFLSSDPAPQEIIQNYQEIARRFGILEEGGPIDLRETLIIKEEGYFEGVTSVTDGD